MLLAWLEDISRFAGSGPTPSGIVIGLLIVDGVLWLAESLRWFGKGWSAVAAVGALAAVFTSGVARA